MKEFEDDIASGTNEVQGNTDIISGQSNVTDVPNDIGNPDDSLGKGIDDTLDPLNNGVITIDDNVDPLASHTDVKPNELEVPAAPTENQNNPETPTGNPGGEITGQGQTKVIEDIEEDPVRKVTLEDNYDIVTSTWEHPHEGDPRPDNPNLVAHTVYRVSGGGSTVDGRYVTPDEYNDPKTAQDELALETFDVKDENGNVVGKTRNTATEISTGTVYTDKDNVIIGSDGEPTGQKYEPTIVKPEPNGVHPGGGMEVKLQNSGDVVIEKTTDNNSIEREISWSEYVAKEREAIANAQKEEH